MKSLSITVLLIALLLISVEGCKNVEKKQEQQAAAIADSIAPTILDYHKINGKYPASLRDVTSFPYEIKCAIGKEELPNCGRYYAIRGLDGTYLNGTTYINVGAGQTTKTTIDNDHRYVVSFSFKDVSCRYIFTSSGTVIKNCRDRTPGGFRQ